MPTTQNLPSTHQSLPVHNGNKMVSMLFLVTSESAEILNNNENWFIKVPLDTNVVVFSDRPHRIAKPVSGIKAFIEFFSKCDFTTNPPNVTAAGNLDSDSKEYYSIFEIGIPSIHKTHALLPIIKPIGDETYMPQGSYSNLSLVVDSVWGWIWGGLEMAGAAAATTAACTVGEVATVGADTAVCVGGVSGTAGLVGNTIRENT